MGSLLSIPLKTPFSLKYFDQKVLYISYMSFLQKKGGTPAKRVFFHDIFPHGHTARRLHHVEKFWRRNSSRDGVFSCVLYGSTVFFQHLDGGGGGGGGGHFATTSTPINTVRTRNESTTTGEPCVSMQYCTRIRSALIHSNGIPSRNR